MVYVRAKKIKGQTYYYLVKSVREGERIRQVSLEYLGGDRPSGEKLRRLEKKYRRSASTGP
ncbi:MAG: hypothetical protein WAX07_06810 [Candidatus Altiarchaeia archaeon]|jgi:Mor family transcriptional regulator